MKIIDISWPISPDMTTYKNNGGVSFTPTKTFEPDGVREHVITMGTHTGTHIDASAHFLAAGTTIDRIPLDALVGPCKVLDLSHVTERIQESDLHEFDIEEDDFILFKTRNSTYKPTDPFTDFVYLDASAAAYLVEIGVQLVGIDYLGIERNQPNHQTHTLLMHANITIVEGLRLARVTTGAYFFVCLPLAVVGLEASPARAILVADIF